MTASAVDGAPTGVRAATAGLLFSYRVATPAAFDAAYRDHLDWHRQHQDHLVWYGWYVVAGARTGMFVDGTFGSDFAAIDRRPKLAEDAAHFASGAAQHSTAVRYDAWRLWPEVSTSFTLEDRAPSPMVEVLTVSVAPAHMAAFEAALARMAKTGRHGSNGWTWYRSVVGGTYPTYLVLIPRANWAAFEDRPHSLGGLAEQAYGGGATAEAHLDTLVAGVESELWRYRADLSYFPPR